MSVRIFFYQYYQCMMAIIINLYSMSDIQQQQISSNAASYDPTQLPSDQYFDNYESSSQSSSNSDDDLQLVKQKSQNYKGQDHTLTKVYHENQYTKIDQKMCLTKVQACQNQQLIKQKKNKDKVQRATVQQVLDPRTMTILKKMINNGTFTEINGCLSTGKEANVYYAVRDSSEGKKEYAVKIYKTSILVFKDRERYVQGEFRFRRGYCSTNPRKMVKMWAEKELRNLNRIEGIIPCPVPLLVKTNVLVMDFIGKDGIPAPKLRQIQKTSQQFSSIYLQMLTAMRLLYQQCKLIHADLSQYNLLYHQGKIIMIDVSQSVERDHPQALSFLQRDIKNINDFFDRKGVKVFSEQQVFQFIVSLDIAKGKEREVLEELTEHYDGQKINDQAFNKIKIHQNLASIPIDQIEKQLYTKNVAHQTITDVKIETNPQLKDIKQKNNEDSSDSDSSSDDSSEGGQEKEKEGQEGEEVGEKERKEGGKQKYQGLTKLERKHKVKEEKRQKRKDKISKKDKKKMMKKK